MFDLPSRTDVRKCVITRETIEQGIDPTLVTEADKSERELARPEFGLSTCRAAGSRAIPGILSEAVAGAGLARGRSSSGSPRAVEEGGRRPPADAEGPMSDALTYLKGTTRFEPAAVEARWTREWLETRLFHAEPDPASEPYSIVIPPPNVTGNLHMGHALNGAIQDVLIRYHRMRARTPAGRRHRPRRHRHAERGREAAARRGLTKEDLGREEFAERVLGLAPGVRRQHHQPAQAARLRLRLRARALRPSTRATCAPSSRSSSPSTRRATSTRTLPRYWCPRCGTAISDLEVAHVEDPGRSTTCATSSRAVERTIATTRPETMLGDMAVAVNPDDGRYADLVGRTAVLPLLGRRLPASPMRASTRSSAGGRR